ncbi:unnamed protein product [Phytophthora fragariaefolia]|uniref:Unnamed protein product n=1 Tax=Phytophthora fragariaefolia TaxID=1490495 RepID=A0A9W6UB44_9STRA|nr:unnamed protein product [Phytophthora fragariaefolia]
MHTASDEAGSEGNAQDDPCPIRTCVIDADPNLMDRGANGCTGLNSDKDPDLREDPEDDESDGDSWTDNWDIGHLTEEPEQEVEELPDSIWPSTAKDKRLIASMRDNGWEYDPAKFGEDPEYHGLYDGPYGPSDSVLSVADDTIALLFYFMPPNCGSDCCGV